jgi:hypothetical protein
MTKSITIADRYSALGPPSTCEGPCEGTGSVPVKSTARGELGRRWKAAEKRKHAPDGWHFVKCPVCRP